MSLCFTKSSIDCVCDLQLNLSEGTTPISILKRPLQTGDPFIEVSKYRSVSLPKLPKSARLPVYIRVPYNRFDWISICNNDGSFLCLLTNAILKFINLVIWISITFLIITFYTCAGVEYYRTWRFLLERSESKDLHDVDNLLTHQSRMLFFTARIEKSYQSCDVQIRVVEN